MRRELRVTVACVFLLMAGCGRDDLPELGEVEGTVTLDGQPLPGVLVSFYPESGGRSGSGETDEQGHYELMYVQGERGTRVGPSRVEVSTIWPDGEMSPDIEDKVPEMYHGINTTLNFDVQPGDNVYDIKMESPKSGK